MEKDEGRCPKPPVGRKLQVEARSIWTPGVTIKGQLASNPSRNLKGRGAKLIGGLAVTWRTRGT